MYKEPLNNNFDFHIKEGEFYVTRCRFLKSKKLEYNYIDYMITSNVIVSNFDLKKPPGISDHFSLNLSIPISQFGRLLKNRKIVYSFVKCKNEANIIYDKLKKALLDDNKDVISNTVDNIWIKKTYKPHLKVPKGSFWWQTYYGNIVSFIKEIKGSKLINKGKKTVLIALKKKEFGEYIEKLNKLDFVTLLNKIKILQVGRKFK